MEANSLWYHAIVLFNLYLFSAINLLPQLRLGLVVVIKILDESRFVIEVVVFGLVVKVVIGFVAAGVQGEQPVTDDVAPMHFNF